MNNPADKIAREAAEGVVAMYGAGVLDDPAFTDYVADEILNRVRSMSLNDARQAAVRERKRRIQERQTH